MEHSPRPAEDTEWMAAYLAKMETSGDGDEGTMPSRVAPGACCYHTLCIGSLLFPILFLLMLMRNAQS